MKKALALFVLLGVVLGGACVLLATQPSVPALPNVNAHFQDVEWEAKLGSTPQIPAPEELFDVAFNQMRRGEVKGVDLMYTLARHKTADACGVLGYVHYFGSDPFFWQDDEMPHIKELRQTFLSAGGQINHQEAVYWLSCLTAQGGEGAWYARVLLAADVL
ncbi:MAG: hypothetical protein GC134_08430 [Proteobacteria bacterium]|nr:hypothetical protein [Pseudomonadota bacterium]